MRKTKPKNKFTENSTGRPADKLKSKPIEKSTYISADNSTEKVKNNTLVRNAKLRDSSCKVIFDDNTLCSQFLRDYIDLPCMKEVQPEDIEDVSAQFVPLIAEERNADRVKKVNIKGKSPFFLISLIEHKTKPDYNVCMQIFRYMFLIWDAYEKEAEKLHKRISRQEAFRYPPVLPIVYYEGKSEWTVPRDFVSRIKNGQDFIEYMPDFRYYLVPLNEYSNKDLMEKKDEISLVMMINKIQSKEDMEAFRLLPPDDINNIVKNSPEHLMNIIADILLTFLLKINVPVTEAENLTDKVREKKMAELFKDMEKLDIQAERRNTAEQRRRAETAEQRAEAAEQKAEESIQKIETLSALLIKSYQYAGMSYDAVLKKITEELHLKKNEAIAIIEHCWNS